MVILAHEIPYLLVHETLFPCTHPRLRLCRCTDSDRITNIIRGKLCAVFDVYGIRTARLASKDNGQHDTD